MNLRKFNKNLKQEFQNSVPEPARKKRKFQFKWRYLALAVAVFFMCFLIGEHITVMVYNNNINRQDTVLDMEDTSLQQINSQKEYRERVRFIRIKTEKTSILQKIFSFQLLGCGAKNDVILESPDSGKDYDTVTSIDSYETNVQTKGIDEADTAKCDGTYIYAILYNTLYIYDLSGAVLLEQYVGADCLYVYRQNIVLLGNSGTEIYSFDGEKLDLEYTLTYQRLIESRLTEGRLYLITAKSAEADTLDYENVYYDGCINPYWAYAVIRYDLETKEEKKVQSLNSYSAVLYMSEEHIYIASNNYVSAGTAVFVSIFDMELNPVGVIKTAGRVLNQFSMDEYNGYFRIVTTNTAQPDEELNVLSVYDLSDLTLTGRIDKGIGIGRQEVKSVRFDGDTCYIVTYLTQDPLYEIDCTDPTAPRIVSQYEAPGYSGYLHTFVIAGKNYILGLGYTDIGEYKISVYENGEATTQIGTDLILTSGVGKGSYYYVCNLNYEMFENHRAFFIYNDTAYLYLGFMVGYGQYTVFKIDVSDTDQPVSVYKEFILSNTDYRNTRGFLVDGKFYIPYRGGLTVDTWN